MVELNDIKIKGIGPRWLTRKALLRWSQNVKAPDLDRIIAYNERRDLDNKNNVVPRGYIDVYGKFRGVSELCFLEGRPWEGNMNQAESYFMFHSQLDFFWHYKFNIIFTNIRSLRMFSFFRASNMMSMAFVLGRIEEAVYLGYMIHAALNRTYQLQLQYEQQHRRAQAFMLRVFADWRGDVRHDWPQWAYEEPIYEGVLERWRDADSDALRPWLLAACDRHTHEGRSETEKRFHDFIDFPRTPIEILYLFRLRELLGLENPTLDHPLMEAPFDKLPEPQPAFVPDEYILGTLKRVREDWPDYDRVVALETLKTG